MAEPPTKIEITRKGNYTHFLLRAVFWHIFIFSPSTRISNAPHRSLPDIPVSDPIAAGGGAAGDTGSELYATVGDKSANDKFTADRQRE